VIQYVYFAVNKEKKMVKIGISTWPRQRVRTLKPQAKLVGCLKGNRSLERQMHRRFRESRITGEWFKLSEAIKRFIPKLGPVPRNPYRAIFIRVDVAMFERILAQAQKENRTVGNQVFVMINRYLKSLEVSNAKS
jgi:hypothetical protein